jgi:hypothetical protein
VFDGVTMVLLWCYNCFWVSGMSRINEFTRIGKTRTINGASKSHTHTHTHTHEHTHTHTRLDEVLDDGHSLEAP